MHCLRCHRELDPSFKACPHCGEAVTDFARRYGDEPLDGKYRIVERLGAGGMGEVYKAIHTYLDAERVIKVVRAAIAGSDEAHDRFLREARLATKVHHPNVATLHDFAALPDGAHYMVWEYIDGQNLAHVLRTRGTLRPQEAVDIARQALDGLEAIHRAGIVHRDISPENLMITRDDARVKIIDLGVAKVGEGDENLTKTGIFVGKLRYASPEHLGFLPEEARIDGRADLYSLAIVLYEMLTGRPPFEATSPHQYLMHHSTGGEKKAPDLTRVPAELRSTLARALERDRDLRFPTARDFADALPVQMHDAEATTCMPTSPNLPPEPPTLVTPVPTVIDPHTAPPPTPRRRSLIPIVAPILILAVIGVMWAMRPHSDNPPNPVPTTTVATVPVLATTTAAPSQTTIDVTTTAAAQQPLSTTVAPLPAAPAPKPTQRPVTTTHEEPPPPPPAPEPQPVAAATFTEGGDGDANNAAVEKLRVALSGVTRIAVVNGGDAALADQLIKNLTGSGIEVANAAEVTIHFNGSLDRLGLGRKRRVAHVTVTKHGHPVFRYELDQEYRVGDTPPEAFARVLRDAMGR